MKRFPLLLVVLLGGFLLMGANGCSSDPNVEGAKLDLRNKDYDRALQNLEKALEKNPDNAQALQLKGQVLQEKAFATQDADEHATLLQEMMVAYDRARQLDPELSKDINNRLGLAYFNEFNRGIQAFNQGQNAEDGTAQFAMAAGYFANASKINPDSTGAYINRAFALINARRTQEAIEPFERAIEKGEKSVDTYIYLADLYRQYEQPDKSIAVLEKARDMYPDNADLQAQLLNAYVTGGQMDRAMQVYKDAVEREPDNKLYQYNYGSLLLEAEDYEGAIVHLDKAVELDPDYGSARYNLGAAYVNKAVAVNEQISEMDDKLRENRGAMAADEVSKMEADMEQMAGERRSLFEMAVPHLEKARALFEADGEDITGICQALFSAYVQTGQQEKAEALSECAGYDLN